jgi:uncharacterized damage-inducible protein DinB
MKESERITRLFRDLYDGNPWIDVTLMGTLRKISAKHAAKKIFPDRNSIWEIVNHLISWRENVLLRVQGNEIAAPNTNYFTPVTDTSDAAWTKVLERLENSQHQWLAFLEGLDVVSLDHIYPSNKMTYYEHILGILQHDAYHLGQVVILSKLV